MWLVPRRCWRLIMGGKKRLMILVILKWGGILYGRFDRWSGVARSGRWWRWWGQGAWGCLIGEFGMVIVMILEPFPILVRNFVPIHGGLGVGVMRWDGSLVPLDQSLLMSCGCSFGIRLIRHVGAP